MALFVSIKDKIKTSFRDREIGFDIFTAFRQVELWASNLEKYLANNIGVLPPGVMGPPAGFSDVAIGTMTAHTLGPAGPIDAVNGLANIISATFTGHAGNSYLVSSHTQNTIITTVPSTISNDIIDTAGLLPSPCYLQSLNLSGWVVGNITTGSVSAIVNPTTTASNTVTLRCTTFGTAGAAARTLANSSEITIVRVA